MVCSLCGRCHTSGARRESWAYGPRLAIAVRSAGLRPRSFGRGGWRMPGDALEKPCQNGAETTRSLRRVLMVGAARLVDGQHQREGRPVEVRAVQTPGRLETARCPAPILIRKEGVDDFGF